MTVVTVPVGLRLQLPLPLPIPHNHLGLGAEPQHEWSKENERLSGGWTALPGVCLRSNTEL